MTFLLAQAGWFSHFLLGALMLIAAVFLILLVLVQRGRGGGLTGALGGMGGQSAFGTKAGDVFTKITMWTAAIWILLCAFAIVWLTPAKSRFGDETTGVELKSNETPGDDQGAGAGGSTDDDADAKSGSSASDAATKGSGAEEKPEKE